MCLRKTAQYSKLLIDEKCDSSTVLIFSIQDQFTMKDQQPLLAKRGGGDAGEGAGMCGAIA